MDAARIWLQLEISSFLVPTLHVSSLPFLEEDAYIKNVLLGSKDISPEEENILLFRATQNYILNFTRYRRYNNIKITYSNNKV